MSNTLIPRERSRLLHGKRHYHEFQTRRWWQTSGLGLLQTHSGSVIGEYKAYTVDCSGQELPTGEYNFCSGRLVPLEVPGFPFNSRIIRALTPLSPLHLRRLSRFPKSVKAISCLAPTMTKSSSVRLSVACKRWMCLYEVQHFAVPEMD